MDYLALTSYLNEFLQIDAIKDYGPQGLQVEAAKADVQRIALAVDTAPKTIAMAASWGADMLLVHHGILWRNVERIAGPFGMRVRMLLENGIHLYGAHLALDAHPIVGNNATLARMLNMPIEHWWCDVMGTPIGVAGPVDMPLSNLTSMIGRLLATEPRVLNHGPEEIGKLAIVSGFGADRAAEAHAIGADTLLTGETSHANFWAAADYGLNIIFAGHYATETVGVKALGEHLSEKFGLTSQFFDFPTAM